MRSPLALTLLLAGLSAANAQQAMPLYPGAIPGAIDAVDEERVRDPNEPHPFLLDISRPTLTPYLPQSRDAKRAAVIILPGGGYRGVSIVKEGHDVARAFNAMGVAAFVLKYRTPSPKHMQDRTLGPLQDAQQAIQLVRSRADEWNIDRARVGVIGFSAGGHLASTAATHFDKPVLPQWRGVDLRPNFLMLIYPVITFESDAVHAGSRQQLLGDAPYGQAIRDYSNELQVTSATPPTFLVHAATDDSVPVANSIRFFEALQRHKVPVELIVYPSGGHGFGLNNATTSDRWIDRCRQWLHSQGLIGEGA
jgi:acetyl esterase/lipase